LPPESLAFNWTMPHHAPALEHDVVAGSIDLRPQDFDELFSGEPCLLQDLGDEDVLNECLAG